MDKSFIHKSAGQPYNSLFFAIDYRYTIPFLLVEVPPLSDMAMNDPQTIIMQLGKRQKNTGVLISHLNLKRMYGIL